MADRAVILYELNEVPWRIVDEYAERRPGSHTAGLLKTARQQTTLVEDPQEELQPWRTWPTLHKALPVAEHKSLDLGQDPSTFEGRNVWDDVEEAGLRIGLFAPLQSWPAHEPRHGGFYVPDTFARSPETFPAGLSRFQAFNLSMTKDNAFSSNAALGKADMVRAGVDLLARGFTPKSILTTVAQLGRERRDHRWTAARPMVQALPAFDLYWRLHKKTEPHLSVFFTNHVAGMMHRYWGDSMEDYADRYDYQPDDVYRNLVFSAMDIFDGHLGRIARYQRSHPQTRLMIASSMGQDAIPYHHSESSYVLRDAAKLAETLELGSAQEGLTMYPRVTLEFGDAERAHAAREKLVVARAGDRPLFDDFHVEGRTLSFYLLTEAEHDEIRVGDQTFPIAELGLTREERLGGGNTAHHVPTGILLTSGEGIAADDSRETISVLTVKPTILDYLGVAGPQASSSRAASAPSLTA